MDYRPGSDGGSCEMTWKVGVASFHGRGLALIFQRLSDVFQQRSKAMSPPLVITECIKALAPRQCMEKDGLWVTSKSPRENNTQRENPGSSENKRRNQPCNPGDKMDEDKDKKSTRRKVNRHRL